MSNCFDCNDTGIDKDFQSPCHCGGNAAPKATAAPADAEIAALAAWLSEQKWSSFAQSLASYYAKNGRLSEKQVASATSMRAKCEANAAAKAPKAAAPAAPAPKVTVPSGHYAIVVDGVVKFYRVNTPTEGKWAGYTFVDAQASDDFYKVSRDGAKPILAAIAADVRGALVRYGHELGRCGICRKTLTDAESIAAGIGPICAGRL